MTTRGRIPVWAPVVIYPATGKIDRRIFSEQAIYDDEMAKIFGHASLMIGHESLAPAVVGAWADHLRGFVRSAIPDNQEIGALCDLDPVRTILHEPNAPEFCDPRASADCGQPGRRR